MIIVVVMIMVVKLEHNLPWMTNSGSVAHVMNDGALTEIDFLVQLLF